MSNGTQISWDDQPEQAPVEAQARPDIKWDDTAEVSAGLSERPPGITGEIGGWARDLQDDIRYGSGKTYVGKALQAAGAKPLGAGMAPGAGEQIMAIPLGALRMLEGYMQQWGGRGVVGGEKKVLGGGAQVLSEAGPFLGGAGGAAAEEAAAPAEAGEAAAAPAAAPTAQPPAATPGAPVSPPAEQPMISADEWQNMSPAERQTAQSAGRNLDPSVPAGFKEKPPTQTQYPSTWGQQHEVGQIYKPPAPEFPIQDAGGDIWFHGVRYKPETPITPSAGGATPGATPGAPAPSPNVAPPGARVPSPATPMPPPTQGKVPASAEELTQMLKDMLAKVQELKGEPTAETPVEPPAEPSAEPPSAPTPETQQPQAPATAPAAAPEPAAPSEAPRERPVVQPTMPHPQPSPPIEKTLPPPKAPARAAQGTLLAGLAGGLAGATGLSGVGPKREIPEPKFDEDRIFRDVTKDEGFQPKPYPDAKGTWSIGYGYNLSFHGYTPEQIAELQQKGISREDAAQLTKGVIRDYSQQISRELPWVNSLNPARREALVNMAYQMGVGVKGSKKGLLGFSDTLRYLEQGDYDRAADNMLRSEWATKTSPGRARRLAEQIRTGKFQSS